MLLFREPRKIYFQSFKMAISTLVMYHVPTDLLISTKTSIKCFSRKSSKKHDGWPKRWKMLSWQSLTIFVITWAMATTKIVAKKQLKQATILIQNCHQGWKKMFLHICEANEKVDGTRKRAKTGSRFSIPKRQWFATGEILMVYYTGKFR